MLERKMRHATTFLIIGQCCQLVFQRKKRCIISHFSRCGNVVSRCSKGKTRQDAPPSVPPDRLLEHFGSLLVVILSPRGGRGGLGRPFGPLCVPCRPPVAPRSIFVSFWLSFWEHFGNQNRGKITYCLFFCRVPLKMGFGVVLVLF